MKKAILCSLMAMTIAFAPAAHATGDRAEQSRVTRQLSAMEMLLVINDARAGIRALRQELSMAKSRYSDDQLVYDIGFSGAITSRLAAVIAAVSIIFNKGNASRATWGTIVGTTLLSIAADVVRYSAEDRMTITEEEMNRLKEELKSLRYRLEGLEAGYRSMAYEAGYGAMIE